METLWKKGETSLFCGFLELWVGKDGKIYPGWEIFFNEKFTFKEKPIIVIKEVQEEVDWMDYMDAKAMETILKMEGDMFTITNEELSDSSAFIAPSLGNLIIGLGLGFVKMGERKFVMQVPMYFLDF